MNYEDEWQNVQHFYLDRANTLKLAQEKNNEWQYIYMHFSN